MRAKRRLLVVPAFLVRVALRTAVPAAGKSTAATQENTGAGLTIYGPLHAPNEVLVYMYE